MFLYLENEAFLASNCIPDQGSGAQCSQCTDCNCVDGD